MLNLKLKKILTSLTALTLLGTALGNIPSVTPASATEPPHQRIVNQQGHVDSPKIFWDKQTQNFTLKAKGDTLNPLHHTINYLDKVVSGSTQEFYYTIPADPRQAFLGKIGTQVFWAPHNVIPRSQQLWIGFGADVDIPVDSFRDHSFTLDLVGFSGPGRMDLFAATLDPDFMLENPVTRLLSSHEPGLRSTWIKPGLHTHNHTTFSQPGRYQVTYRASARDQRGRLVASAPQTVYWQVGGINPENSDPSHLTAAYNEAPATTDSEDFSPVFTIKPATDTSNYAEAKLSELRFTTGNSADSGTAVFFINGYYLTETPVTQGRANWLELLGADQANLQVVFIPSTDSPSPRWVSSPISYAQGQPEVSAEATGIYPVPQVDSTLPAFTFTDRTIADKQVIVTTTATDSHYTLNVNPAQADLPLHVSGGFYADANDKYPTCEVNFISFPSVRSFNFSVDDCYDITTLKLKIVPDSRSPYGGNELTVPTPNIGETVTKQLQLTETSFVSDALDSSAPAADADNEILPDSATWQFNEEKVTISDGHLDIGPRLSGDQLLIAVKDDSRQYASSTVLRAPEAVSIAVPEAAQVKRSGRIFSDKSFDFLGNTGTSLFVLGAMQQAGRAWLGFSTEDFDYQRFPAGVDLELSALETPEGAKWWGFTSAPLGGLGEVIFDSQKPLVLRNPQRTHMHLHWVFTTPGRYRLQVRAVVPEPERVGFLGSVARTLGIVTPFASAPATLTFVVGERGVDSAGQDALSVSPVDSANSADSSDSGVANTISEGDLSGLHTAERNTPGLVSAHSHNLTERSTSTALPITGSSGLAWIIFVAGALFLVGAFCRNLRSTVS